ncbi:MAG: hypothetical protein ACHQDE_07805, partial [Acidimicrobiia bacterium]
MAAVWYRFRAELRSRWRSVFALALLAGIAGGATLAAIAGARRTDSAFSRLRVDTNAIDVLVNPDFGSESKLDVRAVTKLPMVLQAGHERGVIAIPLPVRRFGDLDQAIGLASDGKVAYSIGRPHVTAGRLPIATSVHEVLVNPRLATRHGLSVGDHYDAVILGGDDFAAIEGSNLSFPQVLAAMNRGDYGTRVRLKVVGIGEFPDEIVVDEGFEQTATMVTPAFLHRYPQADAGYFGIALRLRHGAADLAAFKKAVQALPHQGAIEFQTAPVTEAKVARA